MLARIAPGPVVEWNRAVAIAEVHGAEAELTALVPLLTDPALRRQHRLHAVHGHLLERAGRHEAAMVAYGLAAELTTNTPSSATCIVGRPTSPRAVRCRPAEIVARWGISTPSG